MSTEKNAVIDSIKSLGYRVTAADVASKTGLSLHQVTTQLNNVAAETKGNLDVAKTGDIVYCFERNFTNVYLARGFYRVAKAIGEAVFGVAYYLLRVSFGLLLILSLVIIVVIIITMLVVTAIAAMAGGADGSGGGFDLDVGTFFDISYLADFFIWDYSNSYRAPEIGYNPQTGVSKYGAATEWERSLYEPDLPGNFFLECFSFLFGDGDPNRGFDEYKWQMIAELIRRENGVVVADQIAPYMGIDPTHDSCMLPVLARFEGRPEVTETGNIVYVFPKLQVSAVRTGAEDKDVPLFLEERPWVFSKYSVESLMKVAGFATFNLAASWFLWKYVAHLLLFHKYALLIDVMFAYGALFLAIPLIRFFVIIGWNAIIDARNIIRAQYANDLRNPKNQEKLFEKEQYATQRVELHPDQITYTTAKDLLDQEFE
jgi:hypothetical protein